MINIPKLFNQNGLPEEQNHLPLVPLRDMVLFPSITTSVFVGRDKSIKALSHAMATDKKIFLTSQKDPEILKPDINDIFQVGTEAKIIQLLKLPDGTVKALLEGCQRGKIIKLYEGDGYLGVDYIDLSEVPLPEKSREAAIRTLTEAFQQYATISKAVPQNFFKNLNALAANESRFADTIAS